MTLHHLGPLKKKKDWQFTNTHQKPEWGGATECSVPKEAWFSQVFAKLNHHFWSYNPWEMPLAPFAKKWYPFAWQSGALSQNTSKGSARFQKRQDLMCFVNGKMRTVSKICERCSLVLIAMFQKRQDWWTRSQNPLLCFGSKQHWGTPNNTVRKFWKPWCVLRTARCERFSKFVNGVIWCSSGLFAIKTE